ncbi:flagellar basal body P-ring formation chaperone FlgA [Reinekea sp.]|uniref:flagellar basal body P-ring formation chaperone FlgA n=1 Tax=Reinekea sp. TaxID=1970455 RepID=UPI002A83A8E3|nr:flagellar basal body P-ring formation chaperone FlgA [Reinekea sp.]
MKGNYLRHQLAVVLTLILSGPAFGSNIDAIQRYIDTTVYASLPGFTRDDITINVQYPANALLSSNCSQTLDFKWRGYPQPGQNTVKTACAAPRWQLYVAVSIQAFKEVVISAGPLERNKPLTSSELALRRMDIGSLRLGYFDDPEQLRGYLLQRTLQSGQVITPYIVKAPSLISRGDWVTIRSGSQGLVVTSTGEALKDGVLGDQIPLKNLSSDTTIRAWVIAKGVVSTKRSDVQAQIGRGLQGTVKRNNK